MKDSTAAALALDAREKRFHLKLELAGRCKVPIVSVTLNAKLEQRQLGTFLEFHKRAAMTLKARFDDTGWQCVHERCAPSDDGPYALFAVNAEPADVKKIAVELEHGLPAGRLLDIDVTRPDGTAITRQALGYPPRSCVVCGEPARVCIAGKRHSPEEFAGAVHAIIGRDETVRRSRQRAARTISDRAYSAMMHEVGAAPKPGLVDRRNSGAHDDMDYRTFLKSADAVRPYLHKMILFALHNPWLGKSEIMREIRAIGIEAERAMFDATQGVNTHKGGIFSLGLLCSAAAVEYALRETFDLNNIKTHVTELTAAIVERELSSLKKTPQKDNDALTAGERIYLRYGCGGIREEAQSGFQSVFRYSLPCLQARLAQGACLNDAAVDALLVLMANVQDTNVLNRSGENGMKYVADYAKRCIKSGGMETAEGRLRIKEMDLSLIQKWISPGGCADLLAVTIFLHSLSLLNRPDGKFDGIFQGSALYPMPAGQGSL